MRTGLRRVTAGCYDAVQPNVIVVVEISPELRPVVREIQCGTFARIALARSTPWLLRPIRHAHTSATTLLRMAIARWHPPVAGLLFGSLGACFMEMTVGPVMSGPNFHP